jgi:carbon-monoxide dehydrogenase medium subunit
VIPAAFDYVRAGSLDEALGALSEHGDEAKVLAGGHSLLPLMKLRLATPSVLVDIGGLGDLAYVREADGHVAIGALTRHHDLHHDPVAGREAPLLALVAGKIGDPQVRHRGTIGGSIAHADPASDLPAAVLALGGTLVATGPDGEREIPATEFFTGFLESALAPDEVLTEIRVPKAPGPHAYQKFVRRAQDWAIVGSVVATTEGGIGVALVNMASTPVRAGAVEAALASGSSAAEAAALAAEGLDPASDNNATGEFRGHLARVLTARALAEAGL